MYSAGNVSHTNYGLCQSPIVCLGGVGVGSSQVRRVVAARQNATRVRTHTYVERAKTFADRITLVSSHLTTCAIPDAEKS